ncbi:hypothetical protein AMS68_005662 [Peltaster fructicola]|uniref:SEC7 domain-containing protein n=1 Tax=Peltaster fructicola TaxID=286661 RepID=A0A6H0XZQ1_9PEZI|nr:hypothetical protein AMS68_005662 [Peltaster fructicola]
MRDSPEYTVPQESRSRRDRSYSGSRDRQRDRRDYKDRREERRPIEGRSRRDNYDSKHRRRGSIDSRSRERSSRIVDSGRDARSRSPARRSRAALPSQDERFRKDLDLPPGQGPPPPKQKPNYKPTGLLAKEANTVAGTTTVLKYHEPSDARKASPSQQWRMYVFKGKDLIDTVHLFQRSCWLIGRDQHVTDLFLEHGSISKQHAVIQFRFSSTTTEYGDKINRVKPYLIDLESANGTQLNDNRIEASRYVELVDGDVIVFGNSEREYVMMLPAPDKKVPVVASVRYASSAVISSAANPPTSTRPPPIITVERRGQSLPAYLWKLARTYGGFYKSGVKAIFANRKLAQEVRERLQKSTGDHSSGDTALLVTAVAQGQVNRSEFQLLKRNAHDMLRAPIFGVLVLLLGEWLPLFMPFAPYLPPLTCRIPSQITSMRSKTEERRRWVFRQGIQEPAYKPEANGDQQPSSSAADPTQARRLIQSLKQEQVFHLSCVLNLHGRIWERLQIAPPSMLLQRRLARRLSYLVQDDLLLHKASGARDLVRDELLIACEERGLDVVGPPEEKLRLYLGNWLKKQAQDNGKGQAMLHMLFRSCIASDMLQTLRHAASSVRPPSTPPNKHSRPVGYAKGKEPAGSRQAHHARKEERQRLATAALGPTASRQAPRHSHGLSWSSTTRDSLVDNLLTSLDGLSQLANRNYDDGHEIEPDWSRFDALNASFTTMPRPRGHTYSSSVSSDHQIPESPSSAVSSPAHKSRRSASSSNFGINHTLSSRARPSRFANEKFLASDTEKFSKSQTNINGESKHARGWSDASSVDNFHEALEAPPRIGLGGPRSISVDHIRPLSTGQDSMLNRGRPVPSVYSRYETPFDAAPEPMVPAGPRKMQNPNATGPVYVNAAPKQSALRKITTQSDLRAVSSPTVPPEIRERASDFVRANSMLDNTAERQGHVTQTTRRETHSPPREKPGFFKRVFGGGGKSANERVEASHNAVEHKPVSPAPPVKQESRQVSADHSVSSTQQPTLNKKPSSFFRRRKKSTSDADKPPPPPMSLADRMQAQEPSRASVSSLRKVMDPFLADNPMKSNLKPADSRPTTRASAISDDIDIFHSGYTPPIVDVGRTKSAKSTLGARSVNAAQENESPKMKLKVRKRNIDPPATATSQSSFGSAAVDAALLSQSALTFIKTNGDTSQIEPPQVSPMSELAPSINDDRRVSALGPNELPTPPEATKDMRDFAAGNNVDLNMGSDSWIIAREQAAFPPSNIGSTSRLVLQPSEEGLVPLAQTVSAPHSDSSASRKEPTAQSMPQPEQPIEATTDSQLSAAYIDATTEYKERARRIFDGNESDVSKMDAASWLGESKTLNTRTLHEYMALYDFAQMNILTALRTLCSKLVLRGETQQFDRIITALSSRWCECNPNHGFKAQDVVHTICYSLILLNTDLHLADIGEKMSKSAYVKNTLPTVKRVVADAAPNAFEAQPRPWADSPAPTSPGLPPDTPQDRTSFDSARPNGLSKRNSIRPGTLRNDSDAFIDTTSSNMLVTATWIGPARGWENEVETILKSFFTSIRNEPLPLLSLQLADQSASGATLSVNNLGLKRTGSVVSKAPSDAVSSRSRATGLRNLTLGWQGRNNRSRQKIFSTYTMSSSRTSFDDNNSIWSPAQSSTWSKNSAGKTLTSTSMNSLAASYMGGDRDFKHSIGFANALSHAIIREEGGGIIGADSESLVLKGDLLEDESLMLEGAPWAKEGMVKHKHHLEGPDRKAKERSWNECFAVISRGKLTLFNFNTEVKTRSLGRPRTKQGSQAPASLAPELAEETGWRMLSSLAKARPFVWALSLPSGAVHLFQVGTPEIAQEWMTTANYWSARLSKEPLSGGVSNIEYGWSEAVVNSALLEKSSSFNSPPSSIATRPQTHGRNSSTGTGTGTRQSVQSSMRSSFDVGGGSRQRLPGDKVHITDWAPPSQSIMASQLPETEQLRALTNYVSNVEAELEKHHELKHAIELAYSPRHSNYNKAMNNWQRKSEYLLREVVKFRTYIDSLVASQRSKEEVYTRRAERAGGRGPSTSSGNAADGLAPSVNSQSLSRMSSNVSASTVSLHAGRV